jgi:hypothetical protein
MDRATGDVSCLGGEGFELGPETKPLSTRVDAKVRR